MHLGINLGNTLEAPNEGDWAPPAEEWLFDDYVAKGFKMVRIPVRWDQHTGTSAPYDVDPAWMARVQTVVGWGLSRGLIVVVNTHHELWLDNPANFTKALPRFEVLWAQIAEAFSNSSSNLLFEIFNEPKSMTVDQLNMMNTQVLPIIRKTNPNRVVFIGGLQFNNPQWLLDNPDGLTIPHDPYVAIEIHNYDPYDYAGPFPSVHAWGSPADVAKLQTWVNSTKAWAANRSLSIYYGEFGVTKAQTAATGRLNWYKAHSQVGLGAGFALSAWDDNGNFCIVNRTTKVWDADILQALGLGGPPSPPPPPPPGPPPPPPSGCPGGSLKACIALCPTSPKPVYDDCVNECLKRC